MFFGSIVILLILGLVAIIFLIVMACYNKFLDIKPDNRIYYQQPQQPQQGKCIQVNLHTQQATYYNPPTLVVQTVPTTQAMPEVQKSKQQVPGVEVKSAVEKALEIMKAKGNVEKSDLFEENEIQIGLTSEEVHPYIFEESIFEDNDDVCYENDEDEEGDDYEYYSSRYDDAEDKYLAPPHDDLLHTHPYLMEEAENEPNALQSIGEYLEETAYLLEISRHLQ